MFDDGKGNLNVKIWGISIPINLYELKEKLITINHSLHLEFGIINTKMLNHKYKTHYVVVETT